MYIKLYSKFWNISLDIFRWGTNLIFSIVAHSSHYIFFKWSFKKHLEHFKLEVTSTLITISFLISIPENHLESFGCRPRTVSVEGQIWGKKMLKSMRTFGLKTPRYASTLWVRKYKKVQAQKKLVILTDFTENL